MNYSASNYNISVKTNQDGSFQSINVTPKNSNWNLFEAMSISNEIQKEMRVDTSDNEKIVELLFGKTNNRTAEEMTENLEKTNNAKSFASVAKTNFEKKQHSISIDLKFYDKIVKSPEIGPLLMSLRSTFADVKMDFSLEFNDMNALTRTNGDIDDKLAAIEKRIKEKSELVIAKLDVISNIENAIFKLNLALLHMDKKPNCVKNINTLFKKILESINKDYTKSEDDKDSSVPLEKFGAKVMGEEPTLEEIVEQNEKVIEKNKNKIKELKRGDNEKNRPEIELLENENSVLDIANTCFAALVTLFKV